VGGSEEKMAAINEAYKVLSDPGACIHSLWILLCSLTTRFNDLQSCVQDTTMATIQMTRWPDKVVLEGVSNTGILVDLREEDSISSSKSRAVVVEASNSSSSAMDSRNR
jgi:hypothetical protein